MNLSIKWNLSLSLDDILRGQGANPQIVRTNKPVLLKAAERALVDGVGLIHPLTLTAEKIIKQHRHEHILVEGSTALTGPLVTNHLCGALRVEAVVCTIGAELEEAILQLFDQDPLYALAMDGLGNAAVENLAQQICGKIAEQVEGEGLSASSPLSPGSPEWPVEVGQPQIFAMLDASKAGISLTSGGMMIPKKSVSFIVGVGPAMNQANMCSMCSLIETCRYKNA